MPSPARKLLNLLAAASLALLVAACSPPEDRAADFVARAQKLYDAGDLTGAALEARNAAQIQPKNAEARLLLALVAERQGNLQEAIGSLLVAVDADPKNQKAQLKLGTLLFFAGAYEEAGKHAEAAAALTPGDAAVMLLQARLLLQKKDYEAGLARLDAVIDRDPGNLDALVLKAILLRESNPAASLAFINETIKGLDPQKARGLRRMRVSLLAKLQPGVVEGELLDLIRDYPDDDEYPVQLAGYYAQRGRVDDAEKVIRALAERRPKDVNVRLGLVQFLARNKGPEVAETALKGFAAELPDRPELGMALARRYEVSQRPELAVATYAEIARRDPRSTAGLSARNRIAQLAFLTGKPDEGRAAIDSILADVPEEPEALYVRASLRFDAGQYDEAIADLRTVLRSQEKAEPALLLLARTYARTGDMALAADSYRRLLAVNPRQGTAAASLAPLLADQGDLNGAVQVLEEYLKAQPEDLIVLAELAGFQLRQGNDTAAEATARRIMAVKGQPGLGEFELGRVFQARKQYAEAAEAFRASRKLRPNDPLPLEGLADSLVADGRTDLAIRELRAFLQDRPDQPQAKSVLAGILARQGDKAAARTLYAELIAAQPGVGVHYRNLARLESAAEARIVIYQRGLKAVPADPELSRLLAEDFQRAKRHEEAIRLYERLVTANPKLQAETNDLAALLLDHRTDKASFERALELARTFANSQNPLALDTLGWAYYRTGDFAQATRTLEQAVAGNGELPVLRYHLGMAYLAMGNKAGARAELAKAVAAPKADFTGLDNARNALANIN